MGRSPSDDAGRSYLYGNYRDYVLSSEYRRHDPKKEGDPVSIDSFNKKWLASCDETEKLVIYQAAYKGFAGMQILLLIGIVLAGIGKFSFDTGNFPVPFAGQRIGIAGNVIFGIWKMKGLEK